MTDQQRDSQSRGIPVLTKRILQDRTRQTQTRNNHGLIDPTDSSGVPEEATRTHHQEHIGSQPDREDLRTLQTRDAHKQSDD